MTNMKPADELLSIRQKIKSLQSREAELKAALVAGTADAAGDFAVAYVVTRATSRFDRKSAEAELGSLARFDVKSESTVLMVDALEAVTA